MEAVAYVEELLSDERAAGKAPGTLRNRWQVLTALDRFLFGHGKAEHSVTARDLRGFINSLVGRHTPAAINIAVSTLRVYFRWLTQEELLPGTPESPAERLKYQRVPSKPVESLTEQDCVKLIRWATVKAPKERFGVHRTAMLALLLLDTGLRIGEALRLRLADLDFGEGKLLVRQTKTGDFRVVPISPPLRKHLRRYLQRRDERLRKLGRVSEAVFLSESGKPCSVSIAEHSFQRIGQAAEIRRVYPHLLRHTFATQSLLNGAPLPAVMRLGGWRKLSTVQRYTYMNDAVTAAVHSRTSPLAAL